jgi:hypothetical protein
MKGKDTFRIVLIGCLGLPLLFFPGTWARLTLEAYFLTAFLFGALLVPEYPPVGTRWFWKAILPIAVMHSAVVFGLVMLSLEIPEINRLPRMVFGFLAVILVAEWRLALRIIETFEPRGE